MVHDVLAVLSAFIINVESGMGWGIVLLMGLESCGNPLSSEVIMPRAGEQDRSGPT